MQEAHNWSHTLANFFLIDQSLRELGGHHHDYVRCVAAAASQSGYQSTIGTNCRFRHEETLQPFGQLRKVFRDTTYHRDSYLSGLRHLTRTREDFLPKKSSYNATRKLRDFVSPMKFFQACRSSRHHSRRKKHIRNFAMDCEKFFEGSMLTDNDHAFFATVNEMEFMGLAAYLAVHPRTIQVNWHLQFHFNLFDGRTPEYCEQDNVAMAIQNCFDVALSRIPYHRLHFYTTSETLADQFNRLGVGNFEVLAYPVRPELFEQRDESVQVERHDFRERPIRITCPGEVRREKKMVQYLQPLVDQIWENHIESGNVQIVVQRPVRKWPAREKIELQPPAESSNRHKPPQDWVQYFSHPLGDIEYLKLIQDTDCGLLFYDSRAYFSRRAGVLSELLTCGKPVIVPAGSWLGDQISEPNFRYVDSLCNAHNRKRSLFLEDLSWGKKNVPLPGGVVTFDQVNHPFELTFELDNNETGFVMEFDWHWPTQQGVYCRMELLDQESDEVKEVQIIGHRTNGMSPVCYFDSDQKSVKLRLSNAYHDSSASLRQISVHTINVDPLSTPSSSVGVIAAGEDEIPRAIDEIVAHYEHYRSTAKMFSRTWCRQHEPKQTFSSLVASREVARPAA